jgi:uncharacterized membrane protein (DUF106 family)
MNVLLPLVVGTTFWVAILTVAVLVGIFIILYLSEKKEK